MNQEDEIQDWIEAYKEIAGKIRTGIDKIKWVDMWTGQVNFLSEEYPFPSPAVFLAFRTEDIESLGGGVQDINCLVDFYLFYESMADSHHGSPSMDSALIFGKLLREIHQLFHGKSGESYSAMDRKGFRPIETGGSGILYQVTYATIIRDYSGSLATGDEVDLDQVGFSSEPGAAPEPEEEEPLFQIPPE